MAECQFNTSIPCVECFLIPCEVMLLRGFYFILSRWHHGWMKGFFILPVLLVLLFSTLAFADFQKGMDAYVSKDYATALKEWRPLAEQGDAPAQYYLGVMSAGGRGVTQDYKAAVKWYRLAAEQGNTNAQANLGALYLLGHDVTQDLKEAFKWYKLAAEKGSPNAQSILGFLYAGGVGVTQDYSRAHIWINIAASQGNRKAAEHLDKIQKEMTAADISKAQELARECVAKSYKDC